jgi:hypothetical protein
MLINEIPEPRHGRIRKIVNSAVAAHRLSRIDPVLRELTTRLLERALDQGRRRARVGADHADPDLGDRAPARCPAQRLVALGALVRRGRPGRLSRRRTGTARGEGLAGGHPEFADYIDREIARGAPRRIRPTTS